MLYLVGLGLGDARDITVKGLEVIKKVDKVFLESYTSILTQGKEALEEFYGRSVEIADRDLVEQGAEDILSTAETGNVALLVVGDPLAATTHTDFLLRAVEKGIPYKVIHNSSILTAVGCCGLQLYSMGETVSIPLWTDTWQPDSFFDKIEANKIRGLHTLCLLDIKVKEQSIENLMKGRKIFEPPRFMSVRTAADQLTQICSKREGSVVRQDSLCVGVARVGSDTQQIVACSLQKMTLVDLGEPLHSLVIVGHVHPLEEDFLRRFRTEENR